MGNQQYSRSPYLCDEKILKQFECDRKTYDSWSIVSDDYYNYRYYKTINGYITNDYYDVKMQDDNIVDISKSSFDLNGKVINPIIYNNYNNYNCDSTVKSIERIIVYYISENEATPISISYIDREINGIRMLDVECFDMSTGCSIDYSSINQLGE